MDTHSTCSCLRTNSNYAHSINNDTRIIYAHLPTWKLIHTGDKINTGPTALRTMCVCERPTRTFRCRLFKQITEPFAIGVQWSIRRDIIIDVVQRGLVVPNLTVGNKQQQRNTTATRSYAEEKLPTKNTELANVRLTRRCSRYTRRLIDDDDDDDWIRLLTQPRTLRSSRIYWNS